MAFENFKSNAARQVELNGGNTRYAEEVVALARSDFFYELRGDDDVMKRTGETRTRVVNFQGVARCASR